jgi:hypothetical protein
VSLRTLKQNDVIAIVETFHCANSTDGGGKPATHYVKDGACLICDRNPSALARLHGLDA